MSEVPDIRIRNHKRGSSPSHPELAQLCTQSQQCWERAQVTPCPRAASGEESCYFARSASCTRCAEQCTGGEIKNYLSTKKKIAKQLISFCPLFHSPARDSQLPGHRDVLSYSKAHSPALTSLAVFSSIHCPRENCQ